jgi:hypothetical protein
MARRDQHDLHHYYFSSSASSVDNSACLAVAPPRACRTQTAWQDTGEFISFSYVGHKN